MVCTVITLCSFCFTYILPVEESLFDQLPGILCHLNVNPCNRLISFALFCNFYHTLTLLSSLNPWAPNDPYRDRTASLTSKHCILYIYSTNKGTEYFKHGIYSPFLSLQNAVFFIILTYLFPVLFTFYIQSVLKLKQNNSGVKRPFSCVCLPDTVIAIY